MAYMKHTPTNGHEGKIVYNGGIVNGIVLLAISEIEGAEVAVEESKFKNNVKKAIKVSFEKDGIHVAVDVKIHCSACVSDIAFKIQENIKHNVEAMTEYHIATVDVNVEGIIFDEENNVNN